MATARREQRIDGLTPDSGFDFRAQRERREVLQQIKPKALHTFITSVRIRRSRSSYRFRRRGRRRGCAEPTVDAVVVMCRLCATNDD